MEIEQLKIGHKDWQTILVCQMHDAHKPLNGKTYRHARTTINLRRNSKQLQQHWKWIYHPTQRLQLEPTTKLQLEPTSPEHQSNYSDQSCCPEFFEQTTMCVLWKSWTWRKLLLDQIS